MPASKQTTWTGATDSDWDTATNWSNGLPATTDTAVIDGSVGITGGSVTNATLDALYVASTYTGSIGSSGTPLEVDPKELSVDNSASGSTHYIHLTGTLKDATCMIDGLKTGNALYLSGDLPLVIVESTFVGTMYLGNSATKTATPKDLVMLTTSGTVDASDAANVAWVSSSTIDIKSGTLLLGENVGTSSTLTISGGIVTVSEWTATTGDTFVLHGGTVNWNAGSAGVSASTETTVRTLKIIGGTFTTSANDKAYVGLDNITQYGGTLNLQSSLSNIEINGTYTAYAGTYQPSKQSILTQSPK